MFVGFLVVVVNMRIPVDCNVVVVVVIVWS